MPVYNGEEFIAESIRSVLGQTYQHWELIIVDDGSKDQTAEVVRQFSSSDDRIKYICQQNGGPGKARNNGIRESKGDLIAFLDADDLWVSEKLELQIKARRETQADLVFSNAAIFSEDSISEMPDSFSTIYGDFDGETMFRLLLQSNPIPTLSVLVGKDVLYEVGLFDEDFSYACEDYDLWFRLAKHGALFHGIEAKLARYRLHADGASRRRAKMHRAEVAVLKKHGPAVGPERQKFRERVRNSYRIAIAALIEDKQTMAARECLRELAAWDEPNATTLIQRTLIRLVPSRFNNISERLYRTEHFVESVRYISDRGIMNNVKRAWRKLTTN